MADNDEKLKLLINWPVFGVVIFAGLTVTGYALYSSAVLHWGGIWPQFFLDSGVTVLLGAVLYSLQRFMIREVQRDTSDAVSGISEKTAKLGEHVEELVGEIEEKIEAQKTRLNSLSAELEQFNADRRSREEELLTTVETELSFGAVARALTTAEARNAIASTFRVRSSSDLMGMRVVLNVVTAIEKEGGGERMITAIPWFPESKNVSGTSWSSGEDVVTFAGRLIANIEAAKIGSAESSFNATLMFENLGKSLQVAFAALHNDGTFGLQGSMIELIDEDWALTSAGLESRLLGVVASINLFPNTLTMFQNPGIPTFSLPPRPEGVGEELWQKLIEISRSTFFRFQTLGSRKGYMRF